MHKPLVRDSAGVLVVENRDTLTAGQPRRAIPDLMIGEEAALADPADVKSRPDGRIYVLDRINREIAVFDSSGKRSGTIGRPGSGPGELGRGSRWLFVRDDTIILPSISPRRVDRFSTDGVALGSAMLPTSEAFTLQFAMDPQGRLWESRRRFFPGASSPRPDPLLEIGLSEPGGSFTVVTHIPAGKRGDPASGEMTPFAAQPVWTVTSTGTLLVGLGTPYEIQEYGPNGQLRRIVHRQWQARAITAHDRELVREQFIATLKRAKMPPAALSALRDKIHPPQTYPALTSVLADTQGRIWVQTPYHDSETLAECAGRHPLTDLGSGRWDVFDSSGTYVAQVDFPPCFRITEITDSRAYGYGYDSGGAPVVARFRVDTALAGLAGDQ